MTGGSERGAGDGDGTDASAQVPIGWRRTVDNGAVAYISPSGTILSSVEEVGSYLLTDGTCKCGLECPLVVHKVFNFDPGAVLVQRSQPPGKAEEDMTKLCNHRRKVVAMAALCRSMQASSQLPLAAHGTGGPFCSVESRDLRVGPLGAWEEGGWYPPRPRPSSQPKLSPSPTPPHPHLSFPFNGSLPLSRPNPNSSSRLSPRKPPPPSPCRSPFSCYGPPQRYPRPPTPQNLLQNPRPPRTPEPPAPLRLGLHPLACSLDASLSSPPSSSSPGALGLGRAGLSHPQVGSPPPFSSSPSPSGSQDCPSPRQRSRHSSASSSSLSEQGVGVALAAYPLGGPSHSPKPLPPASPRGRLEGMLQQYKDSGSTPPHPQPAAVQSNQSNFQLPQSPLAPPPPPPAFPPDRKSAPANANASAGFLGQLLSQQKQQHASSFPASSLLSAAAKAQLASQKSQNQNQNPSPSGGANANAPGGANEAQQSKVTLSSPALGSTSVSCASLIPSPAPDVADALTTLSGQGKANALPPHLLPPLLGPGVLGDLAALGNMGGLHGMMGAGPLLLPPMQAPGLGMPLLQAQAAGLNPLACLLNNLQLNMGPALSMGGEKPIGMQEVTSPAPQDNISANQLAPEPVPNPSHALGPQPQREGAPGGLLDPYSSFMDTIYTSFLQVSGRSPEGAEPTPAPPPSFPGEPPQNSAPPSLSPRRACSLRNPDLSRLGMEAAQSPARGTPKLSEDSSSTPPPLSQRSEPPAPPAFPEEAKTDCGSAHPYSNGLPSEGEGQGQGEGPQGYHGPPEGVNGTENHMGPQDTQGERGPTVRPGGARRGRKRKQVLPREPDVSREMDTGVSEEPMATMVLQKPERSVKSKRRRVFR
ncbi:methyl-CpG-binding domain protein 6 [Anguilla anguilla]|uniref:methyl-CpG-binding domain protein 6 n=1 Tax=Anguilla anguilla TaxID=7936 RepID=UPI0015AB4ECA|nr:methyl-CpG-binding domain protein 6 [Anguilla anguilla]